LVEIFDKFDTRLEVGDEVLYVPIRSAGVSGLRWGKISKFMDLNFLKNLDSNWIIRIEGSDDIARTFNCVKFSEKDIVLRRLTSKL